MNQDRNRWKVINTNLKGKCSSEGPRTRCKKNSISKLSCRNKAGITLEQNDTDEQPSFLDGYLTVEMDSDYRGCKGLVVKMTSMEWKCIRTKWEEEKIVVVVVVVPAAVTVMVCHNPVNV